jgi:CHAD domain-containing protein
MHALRKQVQCYGHSLEVFASLSPTTIGRTIASAKDLAELLGEDHDLALLVGKLRTMQQAQEEPVKALLDAIQKRQRRLRRQALKVGAALYAASPPMAEMERCRPG